ncbi:MAG: DEAD/DEAH box helicase family protein [Veillonella parvula]
MKQYAPKEFDCIIIDEVHRAGSDSYQRIIEYFEPQFLLGMTASPERTDLAMICMNYLTIILFTKSDYNRL